MSALIVNAYGDPLQVREAIKNQYSDVDMLTMFATSTEQERRLQISAAKDGRYAFVQYDKQLFLSTYGNNRDVDKEWEQRPVHFDYYDGSNQLLAAAPHDFARLYVEHELERPMELGESLQSKHCIWPLLPALAQEGQIDTFGNDEHVIRVSSLDLRVYLNASNQVLKVTWGEDRFPDVPAVVLEFAGYAEGEIYPSKMVRSFGFGQAGTSERSASHEHYDVSFEFDPELVEANLGFTDDSQKYSRKVASTDNVYDADGNLLYNEKEMEAEYLAAIKDSGPGQWRLVLLVGVGCLAIGSAVILKMKRAA